VLYGSDFMSRHMTTARTRAVEVAAETQRRVLISRIGSAGQLRPSLVIHPDGTAHRPNGMAGEDCQDGPGKPPCFCQNCRARRRA
jgi:hypothetical protein